MGGCSDDDKVVAQMLSTVWLLLRDYDMRKVMRRRVERDSKEVAATFAKKITGHLKQKALLTASLTLQWQGKIESKSC